jgi:PTS system fructose-specific IIC component
MLLYPVIGIFLIGVIMTYVVEPPIGALNVMINNGLNSMNGAKAILLGKLPYSQVPLLPIKVSILPQQH